MHSFYRSSMPSGENLAVVDQAEALSDAGHEVALISTSTDASAREKFYRYRSGLRVGFGIGANPAEQISRFNPDVIHVHNLFPNWTDSWIKRSEVPVVATIHNFRRMCAAGTLTRAGQFCDLCPREGSLNAIRFGCYGNGRVSSLPLAISTRKGAFKKSFDGVKGAIFLSARARDTFEKFIEIPQISSIVPNFVRPDDFAQRPETPTSASNSWVFVGRLTPEKGILQLVKHWPHSEKLTVVGDGPLMNLAQKLSESKRISFVGSLSRNETHDLMSRAIGLIFPAQGPESAPSLVYLESLQLGLPTVATPGNAVADDVNLAKTGEIVENLSEIPDVLRRVRQRRSDYSTRSISRFQNLYTVEIWIESMERFYRQLLG